MPHSTLCLCPTVHGLCVGEVYETRMCEAKAPIRETVEFNLISLIEASVVAHMADADTLEQKSFTFPSIEAVQIVRTSLQRYWG